MSLLNMGGCDHEYIGQPGCVCSLAKRLRDRAEEWKYLSDDRGSAVGDMREAADSLAAKDRRIVNLERQRAAQRDRLAEEINIARIVVTRLAAAEKVVGAARQALPFMPGNCEHADLFQPHPENIWCAARHRSVISDAIAAYDAHSTADLNFSDRAKEGE